MSVKADIEELFKDVVFLVEVSDSEQHLLWLIHHQETEGHRRRRVLAWEQESRGVGVTIGRICRRPVVLSLSYAKLNGKRVCFFYACSQLVDHALKDRWLRARTKHITWDGGRRWAHCDGYNFHHCLEAIGARA